ncbi:hypothetical protein EV207_15214 [Scopulibacillus darangshiensis]|uniref:Gamma-type small acid-soluble spore protein n=1 Tax=Scopulibacillus darangshiensis TaxID=442528 RepID=A0A4R2NGC4_9BACL|nr:gamma-type small acid-soluble spore protein [Scopulibacillus darangshiensis]TCP20341.1 hypothetical protein EV207_15214 [Scopulibacillus darangshiensis]
MAENPKSKYTTAGTDIDKVKQKNADSGMSYNEAKEYIARTTGGHNTDMYSNTNIEAVQEELYHSSTKDRPRS